MIPFYNTDLLTRGENNGKTQNQEGFDPAFHFYVGRWGLSAGRQGGSSCTGDRDHTGAWAAAAAGDHTDAGSTGHTIADATGDTAGCHAFTDTDTRPEAICTKEPICQI